MLLASNGSSDEQIIDRLRADAARRVADRRRLARGDDAALPADRRRHAACLPAARAAFRGRQQLWPDGMHRRRDLRRDADAQPRRRAAADRQSRSPARPSISSTRTAQPVAPGWPGELCIGGHGVGRGYRNRPEATDAALRRRSFQQRARRAALSHRRPRQRFAEWRDLLPRPHRQSGEDPRLSRRAGRHRRQSRAPSRGRLLRRRAARECAGRDPSRRLYRCRRASRAPRKSCALTSHDRCPNT